jgi:hypothetical protein
MRLRAFLLTLLLAAWPQACPAQGAAPNPTIAVYFEPSATVAQSYLQQFVDDLDAKLVQSGKFSVVDRAHVESALKAHQVAPGAEAAPLTGATLGRIVGVAYMVIVGIDQLGAVNEFQQDATLISNQKTYATQINLVDHLSLIDDKSGQIVQSFDDQQQAISGNELTSALKASSQQFINDQVPKLLDTSATNLIAKLPSVKFVPPTPQASGHVLGVAGNQVFLSLKASDGIIVGQMVDFYDAKNTVKLGTLQITEVDAQYSVAKLLDGTPAKLAPVKTE